MVATGGLAVTVCTSVDDVLPEYALSPLYVALMEWLPADRVDVDSAAEPALRATVPNDVVPSKNCTVPVAADGDTVAVNTTGCAEADGLTDETSPVVVAVRDAPHDGNLNEMRRVFQLADCVVAWYSWVYQSVQSSLGSIRMAE